MTDPSAPPMYRYFGRDLKGYGANPPHPRWPEDARLALQFVLNLEEGSESSILNGDPGSESYLHELPGRPAVQALRDTSVESMYEYGSRSGFWRLLRLFTERDLPLTAFATGLGLERNPEAGAALAETGYEIAGHGYRWLDYRHIPEAVERNHIQRTIAAIQTATGQRPLGWYTGRVSPNTRRLLVEEGGFVYDSDAYNDDLPYWINAAKPHLVIPYTLVNNDCRYLLAPGFSTGDDFFKALRAAFAMLMAEGAEQPKMMSVGLHSRISGHPARAAALERFLDFVLASDQVWVCRRIDIARHWLSTHPPA